MGIAASGNRRPKVMIPQWLVTGIVSLVAVVFAINYGAQFVVPHYTPDATITAVFGAVVGSVLALGVKRGPTNKDRDQS
jgi:hypothetical protein